MATTPKGVVERITDEVWNGAGMPFAPPVAWGIAPAAQQS